MRVKEQRTILLAFSARDMDLRHLCILSAIKIFIQQLKILAIMLSTSPYLTRFAILLEKTFYKSVKLLKTGDPFASHNLVSMNSMLWSVN